jgi:hypothetical protein
MWRGHITFDARIETWLVAVNPNLGTQKTEATFMGELEIMGNQEWHTIFGVFCTWCMLYSV